MTSRQVELPDSGELGKQLLRLERRKTKAGRDVIDHPVGGHDDIANAVAGLCRFLAQRRAQMFQDLAEKTRQEEEEKATLGAEGKLPSQPAWTWADIVRGGRML
jgi:hypothetical protein